MGQTLFTPLVKGEEQLLSYALDMSTSVTIKKKTNKEKFKSLVVDKDEDDQNNKEFLYKIDVYKQSE